MLSKGLQNYNKPQKLEDALVEQMLTSAKYAKLCRGCKDVKNAQKYAKFAKLCKMCRGVQNVQKNASMCKMYKMYKIAQNFQSVQKY